MTKSEISNQSSNNFVVDDSVPAKDINSDPGRLLKQRLELVEDLWQTVLKSECPPDQTKRLLRLKKLKQQFKKKSRKIFTSSYGFNN